MQHPLVYSEKNTNELAKNHKHNVAYFVNNVMRYRTY